MADARKDTERENPLSKAQPSVINANNGLSRVQPSVMGINGGNGLSRMQPSVMFMGNNKRRRSSLPANTGKCCFVVAFVYSQRCVVLNVLYVCEYIFGK